MKVHLTITNHPTYGHVFADPQLRGVVLGIWVIAARAHISATNDELTLTPGDVLWITGKERMVDAAKLLRRCCEAVAYPTRISCDQHANCSRSSCHRGARWVIYVRNFSRKQGFTPHTPAETPQTSAPSEEPNTEEPNIPHSATPPLIKEPPSDNGFEESWMLYPKRSGGDPKDKARKAWKKRIAEGVSPEALKAGVIRYAEYCRTSRKEGSEYVLQAATFFGPIGHWKESYDISNQRLQGANGEFIA